MVVHDFDGDAMQIGKKTGLVVVQAQIITVNAGQAYLCPGFDDNLPLVAYVCSSGS